MDRKSLSRGLLPATSGTHGVLNDAISIHLADTTIASAFVARCCAGHRAEALDGVVRIREDEPTQRVLTVHHKTP